MNNLTLKHFRYFEALARHRHFGRAAEDCAISQPALSLQIKDLEQSIGAELFERSPRQLRLTRFGEEFLQRIRDILRAVDELGDLARASQDLAERARTKRLKPEEIQGGTFTVTNPGAILGTAVIFGGLGSLIGGLDTNLEALLLVAAVMGGSLLWWLGLSELIATIRHKLTEERLKLINRVAGLALIAFGLLVLIGGLFRQTGIL